MADIRLHDTLTRSLQPFSPRDPGKVGIYACGPTVYGPIHVGNARPYVVFSQLKRFLEHEGYRVTFAANVTDINDKIYAAARAAGAPRPTWPTRWPAVIPLTPTGWDWAVPTSSRTRRSTSARSSS